MTRFVIVLILSILAATVPTTSMAAPRFLNEVEAENWQAVGRINLHGRGFCTGTLVSPTEVLSAAHCFFYSRTGRPIVPEQVNFLAGFRLNDYAAHRRGQDVKTLTDESPSRTGELDKDIALITLSEPIENVTPIPPGPPPQMGDVVTLISYDRTRTEAPMRQDCPVMGQQGALLILDCAVTFGNSGGPVIDSQGQIVAVVSAVTPEDQTLARLIGDFWVNPGPRA